MVISPAWLPPMWVRTTPAPIKGLCPSAYTPNLLDATEPFNVNPMAQAAIHVSGPCVLIAVLFEFAKYVKFAPAAKLPIRFEVPVAEGARSVHRALLPIAALLDFQRAQH